MKVRMWSNDQKQAQRNASLLELNVYADLRRRFVEKQNRRVVNQLQRDW